MGTPDQASACTPDTTVNYRRAVERTTGSCIDATDGNVSNPTKGEIDECIHHPLRLVCRVRSTSMTMTEM